jgi:hypothetical protein
VTETSIEAELGALGRIAVTFNPSGQTRTQHSECSDPVSFDSGQFEGTIVFRGEKGYTKVEATQAPGDLGFLLNGLCPGISGGNGPFLPGAELETETERRHRSVYLKVVKNRPRARAHFEVSVSEVRNGIGISRSMSLFAPARTFRYDPLLQSATIDPPAPFAGIARFSRSAERANRWTGDLTVDLPGRSNVRLTGREMRTALVHAHWDWSRSPR